jgi:2-polyprenyl-6-methoxyphenol hydroxylase-like FAD-dependent oxidoreductase
MLHARLLIGADGLRSVVARAVHAVERPPRLRKLSLSTHAHPPHDTRGLGEMHLADGACLGIAPVTKQGSACNITLVVRSDAAHVRSEAPPNGRRPQQRERVPSRADRLDSLVEEWRPRFPLLRGSAPLQPVEGGEWLASGPFDMPVRSVAHDGIALVGDAAGYFDPFTGQGIHQAVVGAELLAGVAARALRQGGAIRRHHLAGWAEAHAALTRGTRRVQRLIDAVLTQPALANAAIRALARSRVARNALLGVTSDVRDPVSLLHPQLAAATLLSLLRAS